MNIKSALLLLLLVVCLSVFGQEEPPPGPQTDLRVVKNGPPEAPAGSDVTYTVIVGNIGQDPALAVTVTDEIPAGMTFVSATEPPGFDCTVDGSEITCTGAGIDPGMGVSFTFIFHIDEQAAPGTTFVNIATATTETFDVNEENNSGVAVTSVASTNADVRVVKSGPSAAAPGTDVVYSITVQNIGPTAAAGVVLTDTLPGTLTFVSLTQSGGFTCTTPAVGAGGTITCNVATMASGATTTFTLTAHVPAGTAGGTEFANTAAVASDNDPNEENDASTTAFVVATSDVSVVKSGPAVATAGDNLAYTLTVTNSGPDPATDVLLTDPIPAGTTFVSLTHVSGPAGDCTTTGTVTCTFPLLLNGQTSQYTLVLRAGDTTSVSNTATVSAGSTDNDPSDDTSTATTAVTPRADLNVTKSGPASATAGTNVTYVVVVRNDGPSTATDVSLVDTLPAGTTFVSVTQSGPAFTCTPAAGTVTCTRATLAPLAATTFNLTVAVAPATTGTIANSATIGSTTPDPVAGNNTATAPADVTSSADLSVTKTGPAAATAGTNVTYTVTVTNLGPSTAANATLVDTFPTGVTYVSSNQTGGPAFTCLPSATALTCTRATLEPLTPATFDLTFAIAPATTGTITNSATISSTTPDPATGNNTATAPAGVTSSADLSVTKTGPVTATAGTNVTYTVTVTNLGPSTAANATLVDTFPTGVSYVSSNQTGGPAFTCVPSTTALTCTRPTLEPLAPATFDLTFAVPVNAPAGTTTNTATASSTTPDPAAGNNTATALTGVGIAPADVSITKTANAPELIAGTSAVFTLVVRNAGPGAAENVVVTDVLPAGTTLHSAPGCSGTTTVTCNAGTVAAGGSATFTLTVTLPSTPGPVSNTATVTTTTPDPTPNNNAGTVIVTAVLPAAAIPTLSAWALMLMAAALAAIATLRR